MTLATEHVCCNLCGSDSVTVLYSNVGRISTPATQVVQCGRCGLVYLNPRLKYLADNFTLTEEYLREFYLPLYRSLGVLTDTFALNREPLKRYYQASLEQMQPYRATGRVLDVGCAIGLFLAAAEDAGWQCYGVEPSQPLGSYGRDKFGLTIADGELATAGFPDGYFDVVTLWDVTEHLLDPVTTYQAIHRVLRPGGLLLLRMPNWQSLAREYLGPDWEMFVTDHFYYFTPKTLRSLLQQVGFTPRYIAASELVDVEAEAIQTRLGSEALNAALAKLKDPACVDCGSTITAAAERSLSRPERWAKATVLLKSGAFGTLAHEVTNYARWKLKAVR